LFAPASHPFQKNITSLDLPDLDLDELIQALDGFPALKTLAVSSLRIRKNQLENRNWMTRTELVDPANTTEDAAKVFEVRIPAAVLEERLAKANGVAKLAKLVIRHLSTVSYTSRPYDPAQPYYSGYSYQIVDPMPSAVWVIDQLLGGILDDSAHFAFYGTFPSLRTLEFVGMRAPEKRKAFCRDAVGLSEAFHGFAGPKLEQVVVHGKSGRSVVSQAEKMFGQGVEVAFTRKAVSDSDSWDRASNWRTMM
jgi:hypothetical protein